MTPEPNLDRGLHLRAGCDRPEAPGSGRVEVSFYQILQILSLTLFEKMPIIRALEAIDSQDELGGDANQLILFEF
jgi:hypothetical protein